MESESNPVAAGGAGRSGIGPSGGLPTLSPEALDRFVYLVGPPRGGTSIMAKSFYLSDRVFGFPTITRFTNDVWRHRNKVDGRLLRRLFKLPSFYDEKKVLKSLDESIRRSLERHIQDAFAAKHLGRMYQVYPMLYALDPACAKDPARALCWADKGNDVHGLFAIPRYLPRAKFIFIIRDPRAGIASMKRQTVVSRGEAESPEANLQALVASCVYWRNMMQTLLRFGRRYPDRTTFVRYEDFVGAPEETINRLLDFAVGERLTEETLRTGLSQFGHRRKHDRSAHGFGIDRRPLDRWRRMLSPEEVELVTALTWRTGRKLGYELGPPEGFATAMRALARLGNRRRQAASAAKLAYLTVVELFVPRRPRCAAAAASQGQGRLETT